MQPNNLHTKTVRGFGEEWKTFDQTELKGTELQIMFDRYFHLFPWNRWSTHAHGFDLGVGSGRWAALVAPHVGTLHCIDASGEALHVARKNLQKFPQCIFHEASVDQIPLENGSMDFGYSLGVLHHIPDTQAGIQSCTQKLKPGAPFLLYLYYAFDTRSWAFRALWRVSDVLRQVISHSPSKIKYVASQLIALFVYWPFARFAKLVDSLGMHADPIPLSAYRDLSFYTMRTDAYDRFCTRLEQRFTRVQMKHMMENAGLEDIVFSENPPLWTAVGYKKR